MISDYSIQSALVRCRTLGLWMTDSYGYGMTPRLSKRGLVVYPMTSSEAGRIDGNYTFPI